MSSVKLWAIGLCAIGALLLVGCEPEPTLHLTVNETTDGPAAAPGDGICEMTPGENDCSLRAAIEEANAADTRAVIALPAGNHDVSTGSVHVTGRVQIVGDDPVDSRISGGSALQVEEGAHLGLSDVAINSVLLHVRGTVVAQRTATSLVQAVTVNVAPTGTAIFVNSAIGNGDLQGRPAVHNQGALHLRYSTITSLESVPLNNLGEAHLGASMLVRMFIQNPWGPTTYPVNPLGVLCTGDPIVSAGYNFTTNDTCSLDHPTDVIDAGFDGEFGVGGFWPAPGSSSIDAIPAGGLGCGTSVTDDRLGAPRPNTTPPAEPACDIGAIER
ncbi:MAG: hypothetical protein JJU45_18730 [Acidimicrobiia bacterium]|nr:hypothetical protein [Acidimicrobiia bacterium]